MRRLFPLFICVLLVCTNASAQNQTRFDFRDGHSKSFIVESDPAQNPAARNEKKKWLRVRSEQHPDQEFESSDRIAVQLKPGADLKAVMGKNALEILQQVNDTTFVLQASDAESAAHESERLAKHPNVLNATPVMRSLTLGLQTLLAPQPNDPLYPSLWHLENTTYPGIDLNIRGAWPLTLGDSVTLAIADQAVNISHPELISRAQASLHFNFINDSTDLKLTDKDTHATAVAGLALATRNNSLGLAGVAPESSFASWRIFTTNGAITDDQHLMNMFQYSSNSVAVQNHSWASTTRSPYSTGFLTRTGIEQAIANGRDGKGIVMVRSGGNRRLGGFEGGAYVNLHGNANDDGFSADPNVIVVAAARADGRVTRYSSPGANVLVAGLSNESLVDDTTASDPGYPTLVTTAVGGSYTNFTGTSGAVPQIAGIASLILSANPNLSYRDVQQILLLSSRHFDLADPDVRTNGAGLRVSHNLGFGIPDARTAVYFAKAWNNRPARVQVNFASEQVKTIPDPGFLVEAEGSGVPLDLSSIPAQVPRQSQHPDVAPGELRPAAPVSSLPVVYVGQATTNITANLTGKCALIQRGGGVNFTVKVQRAEAAGASMVIIYNNDDDDSLLSMNLTNFASIPSAFIAYTAGNALAQQSQTNANLLIRLGSQLATYTFNVTNQLSLEHVGMKIRTDNLRRSDIRITLTSPQGTQSILQRVNNDPSTNAPIDWTYISNQHFYESSVGTWTLSMSDEFVGATGIVHSVELQLFGVPITDSDADGLDDGLEMAHFGNLNQTTSDDPDGDGFTHLHELLIGSDPNVHSGPVITEQPAHRVSNLGGSASFEVEAGGMQPVVYQWRFNGANLAGATESQLTLNNIQSSQQGNYSVEVSNLAGSIVSSTAQLGLFTCSFATLASESNFPFAGGTGSISVTTSNGCSWNVINTNDWITLTSATNGSGNGTVDFSVSANYSATRTGRIVIAGNLVTISQTGAFLPETIAGQSFTFVPVPASSNSFMVVISHDGTSFRFIPLNGADPSETGSLTYSINPDGTATLMVDEGQVDLTFTDASTGTFTVTDSEGSFSGTFSMLETGPDFNGDGYVDFLFQNTNRVLFTWFMERSVFQQASLLRDGKSFANIWRTAGTADFNHDGKPDILFQDTSNRLAIWLMDGTQLTSSVLVRNGTPIGQGWRSLGIGDFNGDGNKDILFQRDTGALAVWLLDSTDYVGTVSLRNGHPAGNGWRVFAAGDMNGDRKSDVLFHNTVNGKLAVWYFDGLTYISADFLRNGFAIGLQWRAAGVADLNNDGKLDIIFQNKNTGALAAWLMNGKDFLGAISIRNGKAVGQGGKLVGPK
ncbi:MAG: S8 family serine peptidase [Verrucomicrobia bacterium]|nr:S8 family serine peptidase [Verrucomicrobiota bacterium]